MSPSPTPESSPSGASAIPQDRGVDRRAFLARMGTLGAMGAVAAAGGCALPPVEVRPAPGAGRGVPARGAEDAGGRGDVSTPLDPRDPNHPFWVSARAEAEGTRGAEGAPAAEGLTPRTAWEAGVELRRGALEPDTLVEATLARIERLDAIYLAFNTVMAREAREAVRRLGVDRPAVDRLEGERDREGWPGLLHGIPVAVKDNIWTAGVRTTANAHMFQDFVPDRDATLVARILGAGGVPVGKTQMGPLATTRALTPDGAITTTNAWAPLDPRVSPGGSSSGSATAVAAALALVGVGTQTGGSITVPAASQGLTGLKPTLGRVSLDGVIPLTYTRDHPGPLARDARDAALLLQVMAGPDPRDPRTLGLPPVPDYLLAATPFHGVGGPRIRWPTRLGVPEGWADPATPTGRRRRGFLDAMEAGGVRVVPLDLPPAWGGLSSGALNAGRLPERSEAFLPWLRQDVRLFGVALSSWIQGLLLSGDEYLTAQRARMALLRLALDDVLDRCDVIVQGNHVPLDMIGLPLMSFPVGLREPGETPGMATGVGPLPESVLLGAGPFGEERLLAVAALWQARSTHHRRVPADPPDDAVREARAGGSNAAVFPVGRPSDRGRLDLEAVADLSQ